MTPEEIAELIDEEGIGQRLSGAYKSLVKGHKTYDPKRQAVLAKGVGAKEGDIQDVSDEMASYNYAKQEIGKALDELENNFLAPI